MPQLPELAVPAPAIGAVELRRRLDAGEGTLVVDLARSLQFRAGHVPGAVWAIRSRLDAIAGALAAAALVVLTSPDGTLARLAVAEAEALTKGTVRVLEGGTAAWIAARLPLTKDRFDPPDAACIDVSLRAYDRNEGVAEAMQTYLSWEIALPDQLARDGTVRFGTPVV